MINHAIFNCALDGELTENAQRVLLGMGCFWGAEKCFWQLKGVQRTAVGYAGGTTKAPNYRQVCSGDTGHAEVIEVIYNPEILSTENVLKAFWENHDPTQGMRQGNDRGSQYRSVIVCYSEQQRQLSEASKAHYQVLLSEDGYSEISTEILTDQVFYLAEAEHQQYLHKNPQGYCGLGGTGTCY